MNRSTWKCLSIAVLAGCLTAAGAEQDRARGLVGYMAMDSTLGIVTPQGEELLAKFTRHSQAFADDLTHAYADEPRYVPGRFGTGIMVEPGTETGQKVAFRNYLPPAVAELETQPTGKGAFKPFRGARVAVVSGQPGKHLGTRSPVLQGQRALRVTCAPAGSGAASDAVATIIPGTYVLSLFVRNHAEGDGAGKLRLELVTKDDRVLGSAEVEAGDVWQRVEALFKNGKFTRNTKQQTETRVGVRVLGTRPGQTFSIDGLVLEMCGGYSYASRLCASSWMPGHGYRASEILSLAPVRHVFRQRTGSVAFWAQLHGTNQVRRTLFEIASGNRWQPHLQLAYMYNARLVLDRHGAKRHQVVANAKIAPGDWHHYAVTWTANKATMYLDGKPVGEHPDVNIPTRLDRLNLGSHGPNAASGAVVDEAVLYNRTLGAAEVAELAKRTESLAGELVPKVAIRPWMFLETIARTTQPQRWLCDLVNHAGPDLTDVTVTLELQIDGHAMGR